MATPHEDLLDRLVADYADRRARGEAVGREEYYRKHPELRESLEPCFDMMDMGLEPGQGLASLSAGVVLGDFTIIRELGRGGMGVVYLAEQAGLKRRVALKVLRHHLTLERRHVDRFLREARNAARLRHPHIVTIHHVGSVDGHYYIAMEYMPGPTVAAMIAQLKKLGRRPTPDDLYEAAGMKQKDEAATWPSAVVDFMRPVLDAVAAAHAARIVHRDLKPSNFIVDAEGEPSVADFGLAKGEGDPGLSFTNEPQGTPYYMAPEQVRAAANTVDVRTDIYALGVSLYELLTLERPFEGGGWNELMQQILNNDPRDPRSIEPAIPKTLAAVIMQALEKDPARRYATIGDFADDLARAVSGAPVQARRRHGRFRRYVHQAGGAYPATVWMGSEYKSEASLFGIPLIHIATGIDSETGRVRVAKGFIAIGSLAVGGIAIGGQALGIMSIGGLSVGLLFSTGGLAIGAVAIGGIAAGIIALGGVTMGMYCLGGAALGMHTITGRRADEDALQVFEWLGVPVSDYINNR